MIDFGDVPAGSVLPIKFATYGGTNGESITLTGLAATDIEVYSGTSMTQRASDNGYTLLDTDGIDIDGITGIHGFSIDLSDNSDSGFYAVGTRYTVIVSAVTVDSQTVNFIAAQFRIVAAESVAGKPKVDVDAFGGTAGTFSSGIPAVNVAQISSDSTAADTLELFAEALDQATGQLDSGSLAAGTIVAATFAADVDAEILSYLVDDATRIDASALNTATGTTIPGINTELAKVPKSDGTVTWNPTALASIQTECEQAIDASTNDLNDAAEAGATAALQSGANWSVGTLTITGAITATNASNDFRGVKNAAGVELSTVTTAQVNAECDTALADYGAAQPGDTMVATGPLGATLALQSTVLNVSESLLGYFQLLLRADAGIAIDNMILLNNINADGGNGAGSYDNTTDSAEALRGQLDTKASQTSVNTLLTRIPEALFSGITSLAQWLGAMAGKQTPNGTALTEINATGAGSGTFTGTTDSLEAQRDEFTSAAYLNRAADHARRRTQANVEASSDGDALSLGSLYGAIQQMQESSASGTTLTVNRTDGSTLLGTKTLTVDAAADPVTGVS